MADNITFKADISPNIIFKTLLLKGDAGNNIVSITKTATSGLVDTYTITLTDGTTTTFYVTNGKSIVSIELTSSTGNTDTYTITYNDATTQTYNVTNGKEITTVEKTATNVLVDTYTITYNDGTTSTFNVTNGKGITGIAKTATVGRVDTYTISYNDGTTSTFDVTNGIDYTVPTGGIIAYDGNDTPAGYEDSSVTAFTANMIGFTPPTGMSATNVQGAIEEVNSILPKKVGFADFATTPLSVTINYANHSTTTLTAPSDGWLHIYCQRQAQGFTNVRTRALSRSLCNLYSNGNYISNILWLPIKSGTTIEVSYTTNDTYDTYLTFYPFA